MAPRESGVPALRGAFDVSGECQRDTIGGTTARAALSACMQRSQRALSSFLRSLSREGNRTPRTTNKRLRHGRRRLLFW
eukprot:15447197-Alexandrium_andersonii.AAC.1